MLKLHNTYKVDPKFLMDNNVMSVLDDSSFYGKGNGGDPDRDGYGHLTQTSFNMGNKSGMKTPPDGIKGITKSKDLLEKILTQLNLKKAL